MQTGTVEPLASVVQDGVADANDHCVPGGKVVMTEADEFPQVELAYGDVPVDGVITGVPADTVSVGSTSPKVSVINDVSVKLVGSGSRTGGELVPVLSVIPTPVAVPRVTPGRYDNSTLEVLDGSATTSDIDSAEVGNAAEGFLLVVKSDVSAGGGPILVFELGKTVLLEGAPVRMKAELSVVKVPPAPYCPGSIYSAEAEELASSEYEYVALNPTVLDTVEPSGATTMEVGPCPKSSVMSTVLIGLPGGPGSTKVGLSGRPGRLTEGTELGVLVTLSVNSWRVPY